MTILLIYVLLAVGFSFLCSVAEAVLLSVTSPYIASLESEGKRSGPVLRALKDDINSPLAVILTLNTIAHTVGAAGAGAQATAVFGSVYLGLFSAVLTLLILICSEIIPKALGAHYWRQLAPSVAISLAFSVRVLSPVVSLLNLLTRHIGKEEDSGGFSRREFEAMAELGKKEGKLSDSETLILQNMFKLRELRVKNIMTPRPVVFALPQASCIADHIHKPDLKVFSRIPLLGENGEVNGFVLSRDVFAAANQDDQQPLENLSRELLAVPDELTLLQAFQIFVSHSVHIMLVVDEYGDTKGLLTLEDIMESLLGLEIVDETDNVADMQEKAIRFARFRHRKIKKN